MDGLLNDDCIEAIKSLDDNCIDALITDPPAGISFMGKDWDTFGKANSSVGGQSPANKAFEDGDVEEPCGYFKKRGAKISSNGRDEFIKFMTEVMRECHRVLKPGAHGLVWAIPRTSHWTATALENAGFEVRDVVTHLFGSGFPKSLDISKAIDKAAGAEREVVGVKPYSNQDTRGNPISETGGRGPGLGQDKPRLQLDVTAPATSEAKQWAGFGTATKPAVEMWLLVAKPFTTVPLDDIISQINNQLRGFICQQLHAKSAQLISTSNLNDLSAAKSDFAQWLVVVLSTTGSADLSEKMDMFKSPEMAETCLNIALSWKAILDALLNLQSKFTTKMETALITELKILNYSILPIMQGTTTKDEMNLSGVTSNAIVVQKCLESALLRLLALMEISVPKNVLAIAESLQRQPNNLRQYDPALAKAALSEHYVLIRKPISEKTVAANVLKHGVGGINIDGCRISTNGQVVWKMGDRKPTTNSVYDHGHENPSSDSMMKNKGGYEGTTQGRFPANLLLSHTLFCDTECADDCPVRLLDEQVGHLVGAGNKIGTPKKAGTAFGSEQTQINLKYDTGGRASRFFYVAKASKAERNAGLEGMTEKKRSGSFTEFPQGGITAGKTKEQHGPKPSANHHPTVKPQKLMQYLITLITPPGGTVLDPFMGSGSTGVAAKSLGFNFIGIERDKEYFEIATKRIEHAERR